MVEVSYLELRKSSSKDMVVQKKEPLKLALNKHIKWKVQDSHKQLKNHYALYHRQEFNLNCIIKPISIPLIGFLIISNTDLILY